MIQKINYSVCLSFVFILKKFKSQKRSECFFEEAQFIGQFTLMKREEVVLEHSSCGIKLLGSSFVEGRMQLITQSRKNLGVFKSVKIVKDKKINR